MFLAHFKISKKHKKNLQSWLEKGKITIVLYVGAWPSGLEVTHFSRFASQAFIFLSGCNGLEPTVK